MDFFRTLRNTSGLSLEDAARGICSPSYLSLVERGLRTPSSAISTSLLERYGYQFGPAQYMDADSLIIFVRQALKFRDPKTAEVLNDAIVDEPWKSVARALILEANARHPESIAILRSSIIGDALSPVASLTAFESLIRQMSASGDQGEVLVLANRYLLVQLQKTSYLSELERRVRGSLASCALELGRPELVQLFLHDLPPKRNTEDEVMALWREGTHSLSKSDFQKASAIFGEASSAAAELGLFSTKAKLGLMALWAALEMPHPDLFAIRANLDTLRLEWPSDIDFELDATYWTLRIRLHALSGVQDEAKATFGNLEILAPSLAVVLRLKLFAHVSLSFAICGLVMQAHELAKICEANLLDSEARYQLPEVWKGIADACDLAGFQADALAYYKRALGEPYKNHTQALSVDLGPMGN